MTEPVTGAAQIFISELRLQARVGVNPGEQGAEQPISVDIWVELDDVSRAAESERLHDTVDYERVARTARKVVARRHFPLVESLATAIGQAVIRRSGARWVKVRLCKLDCLRHASGAGVEIELRADASEPPTPLEEASIRPDEGLVVAGGGAAGLAAALWCWRQGHPALLVDPGPQLGGQLWMVHGTMMDIPAMPPLTGRELVHKLWRQFIEHRGRWLKARLVAIDPSPSAGCRLELQDPDACWQRSISADSVILATGVARRQLEVPGERRLQGCGLLATAAKDTASLSGRSVVVVGGGDAGCENALNLVRSGARVTLVHRGHRLTARAQLHLPVVQQGQIDLRLETRVTRFVGEEHLEAVQVEGPGGSELLSADAALVRVGWEPQSSMLPRHWLDSRGFVVTDGSGRIPGVRRVFAAGDLLGRDAPSIAASFGSAAEAARAAILELERGS
jgi:thioredoxin reductase (NADPH)